MTPEELLAVEARSMNRPCRALDSAYLVAGSDRVLAMTYEVSPAPGDTWRVTQRRYVVAVNGRVSFSGIAGSERA